MRILYLSQYFPPEVGATQTRAYEMARYLASAGHQVTMLTEVPNHPSGVIPPAYRGKLYQRSELDGIDVVRVWVKASPVKTTARRMAFYLSYMVTAGLAGLALARGRYDLIYATSPPLFVGGAALALSVARRIPLVFEVRDLWPESAVVLGELTHPRAVAWAGKLEEMCYNRARRVVVVTRGIQRRLVERGFGDKLELVPNGSNTDLFRPLPEAGAALRAELGLVGPPPQGENSFLVVYAGIHGVAQGLETILEAAERLRNRPEFRFLMVGEGPRKAELLELRERWALENVTMLPERPRDQMPALLSAADLALVPLRDVTLFRGALPSKMFDAWACGCPVLLTIDGEARQVAEEARAGLFVQPEDPDALVSALLRLREQPALLREMGRNGRRYVEDHYSRQAQAAGLEQILLRVHEARPE